MQATGRQPQPAPDGAPVHCERHRPEQITLYRLMQQHAATFFAQSEDAAEADNHDRPVQAFEVMPRNPSGGPALALTWSSTKCRSPSWKSCGNTDSPGASAQASGCATSDETLSDKEVSGSRLPPAKESG